MVAYIKLAVGAAVVIAAFTGGFKTKATLVKAAHAEALEDAQAAHIVALSEVQDKLDEANAETLRLSAKLQTAEGQTRTITREIIKEIPTYAPKSTDTCDRSLPSGLVMLHNLAALGNAPSAEAEAAAPSGLLGGVSRPEYAGNYPQD